MFQAWLHQDRLLIDHLTDCAGTAKPDCFMAQGCGQALQDSMTL